MPGHSGKESEPGVSSHPLEEQSVMFDAYIETSKLRSRRLCILPPFLALIAPPET